MKSIKQSYIILVLFLALPTLLIGQSYELPEYTSFKLKNGLTVYLMERHSVPVISVSTIIPAGAINDVPTGDSYSCHAYWWTRTS